MIGLYSLFTDAELPDKDISEVVLGCTELPLILKPDDFDFPLWDTLALHALAAVDFMLEEG